MGGMEHVHKMETSTGYSNNGEEMEWDSSYTVEFYAFRKDSLLTVTTGYVDESLGRDYQFSKQNVWLIESSIFFKCWSMYFCANLEL
jgi:hypothetical protein